MHWSTPYLHKPWSPAGYGPQSFNCWGLVWHVYRNHFGVTLPMYPSINAERLREVSREIAAHESEWIECKEPQDGCVVGLSTGQALHHVGIYIAADSGLVLHASAGNGVIAQSLAELRASGWNRISFYQHHKWPDSSK